MASKSVREMATVATFGLELAKQMKQYYLIHKPKVKAVHPYFDKIIDKGEKTTAYFRDKLLDNPRKDIIYIEKRVTRFNSKIEQKDYAPYVYIDFVDKMIAKHVNILFVKSNDTEKFVMLKSVLDALDDLCNYFDQRCGNNKELLKQSEAMFRVWEATE